MPAIDTSTAAKRKVRMRRAPRESATIDLLEKGHPEYTVSPVGTRKCRIALPASVQRTLIYWRFSPRIELTFGAQAVRGPTSLT
jgi:hypothetical protein